MTAQEALNKATRNSGSFGLLMRAIEKSVEDERVSLSVPFSLDKHTVVQLLNLGYTVIGKGNSKGETTEISWDNPKDIIEEAKPGPHKN
jgi:hypothetical protein